MLNKRKLVRLLMILSFLWWTPNIAQGESTSQISSTGIKGSSSALVYTPTTVQGESTAQISSTRTIDDLKGSSSAVVYTLTTVQETRTIVKINPSSTLESSLKVDSLSTVTSQITSISGESTSQISSTGIKGSSSALVYTPTTVQGESTAQISSTRTIDDLKGSSSAVVYTPTTVQGESTAQISSTGTVNYLKGSSSVLVYTPTAVQETRTIGKINPSSTLESSLKVDSLSTVTSQITSISGESTAQISSTGTINYLKGSSSVLVYTPTTVQETRTIGKINPSSTLESSLKVDSLSTVTSQITSISAATTSPTTTQESAPTFLTRPNNATIEEGGNVTFKCEIFGYPQPTISWYKGNITLQSSASHVFSQNKNTSTLQIINVRRNDSAIYICEAVNKINKTSARATLDVQYQPEFVKLPNNETVQEGRNATFVCGALSNPPPIISWYKENTLLQSTSSDIMFNAKNQTLIIINATRKDAAIYNCTAKNKINQISTTATLDVQYQPEFVKLPNNETVLEGRNATFVCGALGNPPPIISWYKENTLLQSTSSDIMLNARNQTLTIINATRIDAAIYICTAKNKISQISTTATLDVQYQPEFVKLPNNETILEGRNATFVCGALSNPPPIISWYKENTLLQSTSSDIMLNARNQTLTIINATRIDAAIYICTAKNKISQISTTATLDVQYVPTVELKIEHGPEIRFTETAKLICNVTSNPNSTIHWKKQSNDINAMNSSKYKVIRRENSSELLIYNLMRNDTANYTCFAKNKVGNHSKTKKLVVLSPPDAPNNIVIKNITAYSIVIQWSSGIFDGNSPITNYSVEYRKEEGNLSSLMCDGSLTSENCVVNKTEVYVTNLMAFTNYTFRVCSRNDIGEGSCDTANVRTGESVPDAPENVQLIKISFSKLRLSWTSPIRPNGVVTGYYVTWLIVKNDRNETEKGEMQEDIFNKTVTSFDIKDLKPFSVYNVTINAITKAGNGSQITLQERTNETFPDNPANVTVAANNSTSINVRWNEPEHPNGIIRHYRIYWKLVKDDNNQTVPNQTTSNKKLDYSYRTFTITGLDTFRWYEIWVSASTVRGEGGNVSRDIRTAEDVPDVPENVQLISISFSKLRLSWTRPTHPNGVVIGYYVTWQMIENDRKMLELGKLNEMVILNETATLFIIRDLNPFSEYNVTVNAITNAGNGSRVLARERTKQTFPDYPANVTASANSSTSIKVVWDEPKHPNGIIIHYSIYWKLVKNHNNETLPNETTFKKMVEYSSKRTYTIANLKKFSWYEVKISASTVIGEGGNVSKILRTSEDVPDVPADVKLIKISFSNLRLLWMHPAQPNGVITGYYVTWQMVKNDRNETTSRMLKEVIFNETTTSFVIKDLKPFSVYNVTINAITKVGNGSRVTLQERTNETFPDYPANVTVKVNSSTSINVRWNEPEQPKGIIQRYHIYWKLVKDDNNQTVPNQTTSNKKLGYSYRTFTITGLEKFSWYEVVIRASTVIGEGENVSRILRTSEDVPDAPKDVQLIKISFSQLRLLWTRPAHPNGVITGYYVTWQMVKNDINETTSKMLKEVIFNETTTYFVIKDLKAFSVYNVTVNAITKAGNGSRITARERTNETLPDSPANVTVQIKSSTSVKVLWEEPGHPNGIIRQYRIYWKLVKDDNNKTVRNQPTFNETLDYSHRTLIIDNLDKFSLYEIRVSALTAEGEGENVSKIFRTAEDVPDAPRNVQLTRISFSNLRLSWTRPTHPNGVVTGYYVTWKIIENDKNQTTTEVLRNIILNETTTSFEIENLKAFSVYNVTVNAITKAGNGSRITARERTNETLPDSPANVTVQVKSSTSVKVLWEEPGHPNGIIRQYRIYWKLVKDDNNKTVRNQPTFNETLDYSHRTLIIDNLDKFSLYEIRVSALTAEGEGENVSKIFRTAEDVPDAPRNVQLTRISFSNLRLSWTRPTHPNGVVTGYYVTWKIIENDKNQTTTEVLRNIILNETTTSFEIENLKAFSVYNVTVNAITKAGNGSRITARERTNETLPDSPANVTVQVKSSTSVKVLWEEPGHPNGIIRQYRIYWKLVKDDNNKTVRNQPTFNETLDYSHRTLIIDNLDKFSLYEIRVSALTAEGEGGNVSKIFRTAEDVPDAPRNVQLTRISFSNLRLSWTRPTHPNGVVTGYYVTWKIIENDRNQTTTEVLRNIILNETTTSFEIENLKAFSVYNVTVNAITKAGNGSRVWKRQRTNETFPDYPANVTAKANNSTSLKVLWDEPKHPKGIILYYRIYWKLVNDDNNDTVLNQETFNKKLDYSYRAFTITGLEKYSWYEIKVSAFTRIGEGKNNSKEFRTAEDVPGPPVHVKLTNVSSSQLNLTWMRPDHPFGVITGYFVKWRIESKNGKFELKQIKDEQATFFIIGNLDPYSRYNVSVSAITSAGNGSTAFASHLTSETLPNASPKNVKLSDVGPYKALVEWTPLNKRDWRANVITYNVKYRKKDNRKELVSENLIRSDKILKNLDENTSYIVSVFARNIIGNGNSSQEVSFITHLSIPEGNKTSSTILFILEKFDIPKMRFYQILVLQVTDKKQTPEVNRELTRYYHNRTRGKPYITAEFHANDFAKYKNFVVGDEQKFVFGKRRKRSAENIQNGPLESGSSYRFAQRGLDKNRKVIKFRDWTKEVETVKEIQKPKQTTNNLPIIVSVIVVLIIVALVVSAVLVWKKRRTDENNDAICFGRNPSAHPDGDPRVNRGYDPGEVIAISDFNDHCGMLAADSNYLYSQEYGQIPRKIGSHTMHHALHQANREKNRYNNILCYDYTRVILTTDPSGADYINASFLGGFEKEKAYIACQGPLENTCEDFWRMVWENLTTTIVMVTGLEEGRRIKCHQYWPSSGTETYGQFNVTLLEEIELTDYTIRSFTIFEEGKLQERLVKQFHYTAWPDHGVPSSPSSLLNFVRKSSSSNAPNSGPMVVHCSAGVGRTGTYVVLDTQLKRMAKVKNIDVYGYLQSLRNQRLLMVQVEDQYVFIHNVLLEAIHSGDTEIQAEDYLETVRELMEQNPETGIPRVEEEFQRLGKNVVPPSQFKAANLPCNKTKNRYANVLPYDDCRVKLILIPGVEGSDYVNANYIDGYMKKKAFIATQAPIPDTISDFWRMVWAQNSLTIVMLSKEMENARIKVHRYWPNKAPAVIGDLMVELMSEQNFDDYVLREFKLTNTKEKASHVIRQYHYISWPDIGSPASSAGMIDLIGQVERWQQQSGNKIITVHCSAGVGRTGVFCALSILIERLKSEHVIDVFQTVRMLRQNRPAMVQTKEQYEYCYTTVQEYLDSFDLYANFT